MTKIFLSFIGGFIVGLLIVLGWNAYTANSNRDVPAMESAPKNMEANDSTTESSETSGVLNEETASSSVSTLITVNDQPAGASATVASVTLENDGWIVVHEERDGLISNALGAARRDAGTYTSVTIPLLRETQSSTRYWVVLYEDDGDRQFNLATDVPVRNSANEPVTNSFTAQ